MSDRQTYSLPLYTQPAIAAVFARRPGCARALYYTKECEPDARAWIAFLKEKGEPCECRMQAQIARLHPAATEGLFLETQRPQPHAPSHTQVLQWQREGRPLLCLENCDDDTIGLIAPLAQKAGFSDIILAEESRQKLPDSKAYALAAGAMESLRLHRVGSMRLFFKDVHTRFLTVGHSRASGKVLEKLKPPRAPGRPVALLWTGPTTPAPHACELLVRLETPTASAPAFFQVLQAGIGRLE